MDPTHITRTLFIGGTIGCLLKDGNSCSATALISILLRSSPGTTLANHITSAPSQERNQIPKHGPMDLITRVCGQHLPPAHELQRYRLGWLDLIAYYIVAFKTGKYPVIERDRVIMWARLYPAQAGAPDRVGRPGNWQFVKVSSPRSVYPDLLACRRRTSSG